MQYTVEKEGVQIKKTKTEGLDFKIDISKKFLLLDFSDVYFEVEDLLEYNEYISGDGTAEKSKGNLYFHKSGYDGENTILIAEKKELTNMSYKSLVSIIEVMFDSKETVNYFKENYSSLSSDKEFPGFKIELNPSKTDFEEKIIPFESGYKFFRVSVNKN